MAWTERYVTNSGAGAADGTSLANAWSWATMLTSLSSGQRANVQGTISRTTASDTFTNAGTAAAPISIRGINSSDGDLDANGRTRGGALVTTNFPVVTYTTGGLTLPNYMVAEAVSFTSARTGSTVTAGNNGVLRRCKFANTHASSASAIGLTSGSNTTIVDDCDATCASSSSSASAFSGTNLVLLRSLATGNTSGAGCINGGGGNQTLIACVFRDAGYGYVTSGSGELWACSFRNITNTYISQGVANGPISMQNCVAWGSGGSSKWYNSTTSVRHQFQCANFLGNFGASDTNEGDWPVYGEVALSADPFTSSSDLTLNDTAGGGADVKAAGYPAYLDGGAWQSQAASGGGLFLPRGFTGGISA